jgi:membrane protease YdiL (CAAX protease family)
MYRSSDNADGFPRRADETGRTWAYFALACGITWVLAVPLALAWSRHEVPPPYALACAGLSAFGPLLAALMLARTSGERRDVFSRWRASPGWIAFALLAPVAVHTIATALYVASGGQPDAWFHPPHTSEQLAALVVFPIGEEFGWRGFAHPRMVRRFGQVRGSLILGLFWGLWHLVYSVTPHAGAFDPLQFGIGMLELPFYSVLIAWVFERANRSMAVAIAFHAGAHLDHLEQAPAANVGHHVAHIIVVALMAAVAAHGLVRAERARAPHALPAG